MPGFLERSAIERTVKGKILARMSLWKSEGILKGQPIGSIPECSLGEYLLSKLKSHPKNKILQVDAETGISQTCEDFLKISTALAEGLKVIGFQEDDVVGMLCKNNFEASEIVFATWLLGAAIAPINASMKHFELKHALELVRPKMVFCEEEMLPNVCSCLQVEFTSTVILINATKNLNLNSNQSLKFRRFEDILVKVDFQNYKVNSVCDAFFRPAAILPSSGTTGLPKGVALTHKNLTFQALNLQFVEGFRQGLDFLQISHFFWVTGVLSFIRSLTVGMKRILIKEVNCISVLKAIDKYKPAWTLTAPLFLLSLSKSPEFELYDVSSLSTVLVGGSPFSPALAAKIKDKWKHVTFVQIYGTTETSGILTATDKTGDVFSVGKVTPGVQLKIVDPVTNELQKSYGLGEIRIKTPGAMKCYVGNEEATAESKDVSGWFCTGDIGYRDDSGQVYVVDRQKEIIKIDNMQVSPAEIENALMFIAGVIEAGVTAVTRDGSRHCLKAFIVKSKNQALSEEDILSHVENTFSDHKKLEGGVHFVEFLPKTANGKIDRRQLKEMGQSLFPST